MAILTITKKEFFEERLNIETFLQITAEEYRKSIQKGEEILSEGEEGVFILSTMAFIQIKKTEKSSFLGLKKDILLVGNVFFREVIFCGHNHHHV